MTNLPDPLKTKSQDNDYLTYDKDISNIDVLIEKFNTPTQNEDHFNSLDNKNPYLKPEHPAGEQPYSPPGSMYREPEPIDPEKAKRTGRRTAVMIDGAMGFVNGSLIAKADETDPYKASPGELNDLSDAWAEVAEEYSFSVNPWFKLGMLNLTTYLPRSIKAMNDRKYNILKQEMEEMKKSQEDLKHQIDQLQSKKDELNKS